MRNDQEARKIMALTALAENYGKEFSDALLNAWLDLLAEYPSEQVESAVKAVIKSYEYKTLPPFAVIQRELDRMDGTSKESLELQALAEWSVLQDEIIACGWYSRPQLHPTTAYVVRLMGGWQAVCEWETKYIDVKHKDFIAHWAAAHGRVDKMMLGAAGAAKALAFEPERKPGPVLLGDAMQSLGFTDTEEVQ